MTWEIKMTWMIKDYVIIVNGKDEFEHLPWATIVTAIVTASLGYLNSLVFYYWLVKSFWVTYSYTYDSN